MFRWIKRCDSLIFLLLISLGGSIVQYFQDIVHTRRILHNVHELLFLNLLVAKVIQANRAAKSSFFHTFMDLFFIKFDEPVLDIRANCVFPLLIC